MLPAIGVSVKRIPEDTAIKLIEAGHQISISEITIFELSAMGAKHITLGTLTPERVSRGIRAIVHDDRMEKIPIHDGSVLLTAFRLRRSLNDFVDCLILSSAINRSDLLSTEDRDIQNLGEKELLEIIQTTNPEFKIQNLASLA